VGFLGFPIFCSCLIPFKIGRGGQLHKFPTPGYLPDSSAGFLSILNPSALTKRTYAAAITDLTS
jgi:hypothetical protein